MKPEIGGKAGSSEMAQEEFDPLDLMWGVAMLILEARTPDPSVKGRVEGPHCPRFKRTDHHICSRESIGCLHAMEFRQRLDVMWRNGIPSCIDVLLFPTCEHGMDEARSIEDTSNSIQENSVLLERWNIHCELKRHGEWMEGVIGNMLLQAVRSYLYFSQLSSWLMSYEGHLPFTVAYRLYAPGEQTGLNFMQTPDTHNFPTGICGTSGLKIHVTSLPRQNHIPNLICAALSLTEIHLAKDYLNHRFHCTGARPKDKRVKSEKQGKKPAKMAEAGSSERYLSQELPNSGSKEARNQNSGLKGSIVTSKNLTVPLVSSEKKFGHRKAVYNASFDDEAEDGGLSLNSQRVTEGRRAEVTGSRISTRELLESHLRPLQFSSSVAPNALELHSPKVLLSTNSAANNIMVTKKKRIDFGQSDTSDSSHSEINVPAVLGISGAKKFLAEMDIPSVLRTSDAKQFLAGHIRSLQSPLSSVDIQAFLANLQSVNGSVPKSGLPQSWENCYASRKLSVLENLGSSHEELELGMKRLGFMEMSPSNRNLALSDQDKWQASDESQHDDEKSLRYSESRMNSSSLDISSSPSRILPSESLLCTLHLDLLAQPKAALPAQGNSIETWNHLETDLRMAKQPLSRHSNSLEQSALDLDFAAAADQILGGGSTTTKVNQLQSQEAVVATQLPQKLPTSGNAAYAFPSTNECILAIPHLIDEADNSDSSTPTNQPSPPTFPSFQHPLISTAEKSLSNGNPDGISKSRENGPSRLAFITPEEKISSAKGKDYCLSEINYIDTFNSACCAVKRKLHFDSARDSLADLQEILKTAYTRELEVPFANKIDGLHEAVGSTSGEKMDRVNYEVSDANDVSIFTTPDCKASSPSEKNCSSAEGNTNLMKENCQTPIPEQSRRLGNDCERRSLIFSSQPSKSGCDTSRIPLDSTCFDSSFSSCASSSKSVVTSCTTSPLADPVNQINLYTNHIHLPLHSFCSSIDVRQSRSDSSRNRFTEHNVFPQNVSDLNCLSNGCIPENKSIVVKKVDLDSNIEDRIIQSDNVTPPISDSTKQNCVLNQLAPHPVNGDEISPNPFFSPVFSLDDGDDVFTSVVPCSTLVKTPSLNSESQFSARHASSNQIPCFVQDEDKINDLDSVIVADFCEETQSTLGEVVSKKRKQSCPVRTKSVPDFSPKARSKASQADGEGKNAVTRGRLMTKDRPYVEAGSKVLTGQEHIRQRMVKSASMVFHSRSGFPTQSSPAPIKRRSTGRFDYDDTLTSTCAIKNALSMSRLTDTPQYTNSSSLSRSDRILSTSAPAFTNCLLGNFEESVLNGRLEPAGMVDGFTADIGASGSFCPRHLSLPVTAYFFHLSDDNAPSPYLGHISLQDIGKKGYHIPRKGTLQVTLFNPNKTVVKMFVVMYDLDDMPPHCQTVIRQRTVYMPVDSQSDDPSYLRYLIHLRVASSTSGKIYLHTDVRLIFARNKFELDSSIAQYELRSFTETPVNPKYSPKR